MFLLRPSMVIKRKYVHSFTILDVKALVYVNEVSKLYPQVVAGHFVHLDVAFLYVI